MRTDSITLLAEPAEIHEYVMSLWSDGPVLRSHRSGGAIHRLVDRFAQLPRIFFDASDVHHEWTHFSTWWGAILRARYDNPAIRDLRYLHEIHHAATSPNLRGLSFAAFAARSLQNEREASAFTEIAIYLELPDLRPSTFPHPIFADRLLFSSGDLTTPDAAIAERWAIDRDTTFQEILYERLKVVLADDADVDPEDPQTVWLRRYPEQGDIWTRVWADRHRTVEDGMVTLRERCRSGPRRDAARRHLDWLLSPAVADGTDVPFHAEAVAFRTTFDDLVAAYEGAMERADQTTIRHADARTRP